jgi:hypothetical protein
MTVTGTSTARKAVERLEALAADLDGRGFATRILEDSGYPCVNVVNRTATQLCENVYAAPAGDGSLWLWWSWAERLAPIDDIAAAALKIERVLTPHESLSRGDPHVRRGSGDPMADAALNLGDLSDDDLIRAIGAMGTLKITLADDVMGLTLSILYDHLIGEASRRGWDPPDGDRSET